MTKFCTECKEPLSFFRGLSSSICKVCEEKKIIEENKRKAELLAEENKRTAELLAERKKIKSYIVANKEITDNQIEQLKKQEPKDLITFYNEILSQFESDGKVEKGELETLQAIQISFGLPHNAIHYDEKFVPYTYAYTIKEENKLPPCEITIGDGMSHPILKKGEEIHYITPVILKEIRVKNLGYVGGSQGVSFRIMKGVSYRVGATRGHILKEEALTETSRGFFIITNKRLLLQPLKENKAVSIPLEKVISYNCYENGVDICKDGREKGFFFQTLTKGSPEVVGLILEYLFNLRTKSS
jgi:hypothetical protein